MQLTVLQPQLHEARWWETMADGRLHCYLCPRHCHIGEGQHGFCFIRKNEAGRLVQLGYGRPAAIAMDPVEKKPLNHFFPGTKILSMGTAGCNMGCFFCQNWDISKAKSDQVNSLALSPERRGRSWRWSITRRTSPSPTTSRPSGASTSSILRARRMTPG